MTLDNMTGITKGSYTGGDLFCKSQLITCNRAKECNGVCPFEDALKHADKEMNEQTVIDHDRDWIIGCIQHDGFIHTHRFDKANRIILEALQTDVVRCKDCEYKRLMDDGETKYYYCALKAHEEWSVDDTDFCSWGEMKGGDDE